MRIVGYYGSILLVFSVYVTLIISALIWAFIVKRAVHIENQPLLLELPPYRRPLIENNNAKSWIRMKVFVYLVIPLLVIGGVIYAILNITGITNTIVEPLSPITQ
jgi:ferrous iron transport protein B